MAAAAGTIFSAEVELLGFDDMVRSPRLQQAPVFTAKTMLLGFYDMY